MKDNYFLELENNLAKDVEISKKLILDPILDVKVSMSLEEMEKELLSVSALHHICARYRSRGKSPKEISKIIAKQYGYEVTPVQVGHMVSKVLSLNYRMTPKSTELLKQQVEDQLDGIIQDLYKQAEDEGRSHLTLAEQKMLLGVIDRRIKMWGLDEPTKVEVSVVDEVKQLQGELYKKLEGVLGEKGLLTEEEDVQITLPNYKMLDIS